MVIQAASSSLIHEKTDHETHSSKNVDKPRHGGGSVAGGLDRQRFASSQARQVTFEADGREQVEPSPSGPAVLRAHYESTTTNLAQGAPAALFREEYEESP